MLLQGLLLAPAIFACVCIFIQDDISQSMFHSLPAPELPVICVKMLVHEPHSRDPQEFKYYQALTGAILYLILEVAEG